MRHQIVNTARNTIHQNSQLVEIIPRTQKVVSPRNDKSLQRRSKSITHSQLSKIINSNTNQSLKTKDNINSKQHTPSAIQIQKRIYQQFKNDLAKYIQQNSRLKAENLILSQRNNLIDHQTNNKHQNHNFKDSQHNPILQSYYTRIKAIEEHISLYELQSRANIIYSQCLIEISKCLSRQQLTINELRSQISNLMLQCDSYKQQIRRISEQNHTKQYNMNQQLQKVIIDFNQAIFSKNDLQIKIFDLTTQNNSLRAQISDCNSKIQELQYEIKKVNISSSRLNNSRFVPKTQNPLQQLKINLQNSQRQNQHLKLEIQTYLTKLNHYHGSQLNYKQQIIRLNNFIAQLNAKWNVQFEHNNHLQQQRNNNLKQISSLNIQLQKSSHKIQDLNRIVNKHNNQSLLNQKQTQQLKFKLQSISQLFNKQKENNINIDNYNLMVLEENKVLLQQINNLNNAINHITTDSQNKQNSYLQQLNILRQQLHLFQLKIDKAGNNLIQKQQEMRIMSQQLSTNNTNTIQFLKNQSRSELERQKNYNLMLNQKINQLEQKIVDIHKQNMNYQKDLSNNRILICDLENKLKIKAVQSQQAIQRMENMFILQRQTLINTQGLVQTELKFSHQKNKQLEANIHQIKQNQLKQYQNISMDNQLLNKSIQENEIVIQNLKKRLQYQQEIQMQRNKYQIECRRIQIQLNNRSIQIQQFIKRTDQEHMLRKKSYQQQIQTLHQCIQRGEQDKRILRQNNQQQIVEMMKRQNQLRNILMMKQSVISQNNQIQQEIRTLVQNFKLSFNNNIQSIRNDFISKISLEYSKNIQKQLELNIKEHQQKLYEIVKQMNILINKQQINIDKQIINQLNLTKQSLLNSINKVKNDANNNLKNIKTIQTINKSKLSDLQTQTKIIYETLKMLSRQYNSYFNSSQKHNYQLQLLSQQLQTLKHTNQTITSANLSSEQIILSLKNQMSTGILKYDQLKFDSQNKEDALHQQLRAMKISLSQLEKYNHQLATRLSFAEHDRTIERLHSMTDLNRSLQNHRSRVQINVGTQKDIRNRQNPEVILIEDGQTLIKNGGNKGIDKIGGTQVIVNIIQKQQSQEKVSYTVQSPKVNQNLQTFGILPKVLNQQPNSPTHRVYFANRRKSKSPPIVLPEGIEIIKHHNKSKNKAYINEQQQFVSRKTYNKIKQIPYISVLNDGIQTRLKPTSPPVNRISTIKASTSEPIIHFPDSNRYQNKEINQSNSQQKMSGSLFNSNSQAHISNQNQLKKDVNYISEIRY